MQQRSFFVISLFILLLSSCETENRSNTIVLFSKDRHQQVTIFSDYMKNERIIANGNHLQKPKSDFYKIDISNISKVGDEIGICWKPDGWEIVNDKSKLLLKNIDTIKYQFRENWFSVDQIPDAKYYRKTNCFTLDLLNESKPYPESNGFVERK